MSVWCLGIVLLLSGCGKGKDEARTFTDLSQLAQAEFAVPSGTVADDLVRSRFPDARFVYFNSVLDSAMAVKVGKADAVAYDEPLLRNIAGKNPGLKVLSGMITVDHYGFAVHPENLELKEAIDRVMARLKSEGTYEQMMQRWLPEKGSPAPLPAIPLNPENGVLRFGTAAVTEPFSFVDSSGHVTGLDIEIAQRVAQELKMGLEVIDMNFGALLPALISKRVDFVGACITITDERAKSVLFSEPYYQGGIAALVRE
jgi:polar amino acid transport system substrate-binding protein